MRLDFANILYFWSTSFPRRIVRRKNDYSRIGKRHVKTVKIQKGNSLGWISKFGIVDKTMYGRIMKNKIASH